MASICGRMALRAAARQNVTYTPVRFCKSKFHKDNPTEKDLITHLKVQKNEAPHF